MILSSRCPILVLLFMPAAILDDVAYTIFQHYLRDMLSTYTDYIALQLVIMTRGQMCVVYM